MVMKLGVSPGKWCRREGLASGFSGSSSLWPWVSTVLLGPLLPSFPVPGIDTHSMQGQGSTVLIMYSVRAHQLIPSVFAWKRESKMCHLVPDQSWGLDLQAAGMPTSREQKKYFI